MAYLEGRKALVMGVANNHSLAYFIAKQLRDEGAEIALSYSNPSLAKRVLPLAEGLGSSFCELCDVEKDGDLDQLFSSVKKNWGQFDILIHSIAFAKTEELEKPFIETSREGFHKALNVSTFSFLDVARRAEILMHDGGAIITLTNSGSDRVIPGYGVMGVAKAALESSMRYLAADLGAKKIRVNAISAGPIKTLSAGGIKNFRGFLETVEQKSPLRENISGNDVGALAAFLCGPGAKHITGSVLFVDSGSSILGA